MENTQSWERLLKEKKFLIRLILCTWTQKAGRYLKREIPLPHLCQTQIKIPLSLVRPYRDVRIRHTFVLDDPYPDPEGLNIPEMSPERDVPEDETVLARLGANEGAELTEFIHIRTLFSHSTLEA
jgi:hypothetical protein